MSNWKTPNMGTKSQIAGSVRQLRQVKAGIQARVCVGQAPEDYVWVEFTTWAKPVQDAVAVLNRALVDEADRRLKAAQDDTEARGGRPVGRR